MRINLEKRTGPTGAVLLVLLSASAAHAYIDPGSGSMLLQLLLGGVAGLVVLAKLYWQRLLRVLGIGGRDTEREIDSDRSRH